MDIVETGVVLAKIQAFDNRNVDDATTIAWQEVLAPHTLQDCLAAVADYFRTNTAWIMPAHIVGRVKDAEQDRLRAFRDGLHLNRADEESRGNWSESMRALNRAAATGRLTPAEYAAYQDGALTLTAALSRKAIK